jgi:enamine deaminase RidA (YjgF/YER057c/UK114 family)
MSVERIETNERLSQAVKANGFVFLSGQPADHTAGKDVGAQTTEILARIDRLLAEAGSSKSSIVQATVLLQNMDDWDAMNQAWVAWMPKGNAPTRYCMESRFTTSKDHTVEIAAVAAIEK